MVGMKAVLGLLPLATCVMSQGINLDGGVITRTDVTMYANLAMDLRDMRKTQDGEAILRLYLDGRNAEEKPGFFFPLKKLGDLLNDAETPNILFHLYGLAELMADKSKNSQHYSDRFIRSTITSNPGLTPDAIVALDMWMYATHLLNWGVDLCAKRAGADNPDALESLGGGGMDEFIALWIGAYQTPGTAEGHSLYAWTQEAGNLFGTNNPEARANEDLKLLYQDGAGILSLQNACTKEDSNGVEELWAVSQQMISKMFIPQIQMLIHSLLSEDQALATLYATAFVPQVAQCRPSVFKRLNDALLKGTINFGRTQEILNDIELAMDCFGLTCEDIGSYRDGRYTCNADQLELRYDRGLAGYRPSTKVHQYAKIDQDILQLDILMSLGSWHFARYFYQYGRNSLKERDSDNDAYELLSLHELAVAADRKRADPIYSYFIAYFNNNNYADKAVDEALRGVGKWAASEDQRREVVVATCAYQIVFLYMISELKQAVSQCRNPEFDLIDASMHPWDEVGALIIGSLEGPNEGGSSDLSDGQLNYNLANSRAFQFQTLNDEGYSFVNSDIEDLLFSGKGELDALDCDNLETTANRLVKLAIVPLVQSAIRYAIVAERLDNAGDSVEAALGEVFAFSVLPILSAVDAESAEVIRENMEVKEGVKPVRDGSQAVADAFGAAVVEWDLACPNLGFTPQADPCRLQGGHKRPREYTPISSSARRDPRFGLVCAGALLVAISQLLL